MGKRGPAPKPTNLKLLQGNPGKRPLNDNEPDFGKPKEPPTPPGHLGRYGKTEWKRIIPLLMQAGVYTEADMGVLAAYCQAYHRWVEAEKKIRAKKTLTFITDKGYEMQIPEIGIANTAMKQIKEFAKEFGLTPSSRTGIHIDKPEETEDPFAEFVKGGRNHG